MPRGGRRPGAGRKYLGQKHLYGSPATAKVDVSMPRELHDAIAARARERGCSRSRVIVNLLAQVLWGEPLNLPAVARPKDGAA